MSEELELVVSERALFDFHGEAGFPEGFRHCRQPLKVFLQSSTKHLHIIKLSEVGLRVQSPDGGVHNPLERCRFRAKIKRHYLELVEDIQRDKGRLLTVAFVDINLPVAAFYAHRRQKFRMAKAIQDALDK